MNELIETLEYLSLLINIELIEGVEIDETHLKLLTKVRNQIDELILVVIVQDIRKQL